MLVGGLLGAIAMVALGLGIGFSVWGGTANVDNQRGAAPSSPFVPSSPFAPPARRGGGFLGVEVVPSGFGGAAAPAAGAYVVQVLPSSPAAKAGIVKGDTITRFATRPVQTPLTLRIDVLRRAPGSRVKVGWVTASGRHESATVTLARRPGTRTVG